MRIRNNGVENVIEPKDLIGNFSDLFTNGHIDNAYVNGLPADISPLNSRRQVLGACYSLVMPKPVSAPRCIAYSREMLQALGMVAGAHGRPLFARVFGGNGILEGMAPFATCYGGHQFGNWAGQLGDGRAISLCEVITSRGERWELQLKGAGPTPYSRMGDGRAVMRSSVREFLCSEAMHHLGIPTTRALSLVQTGDQVIRDMFYDGHSQAEPGAIVCRVAPSFIRFGHFEILAARQDTALLKRLVDFTIKRDFPHLGQPDERTYLAWFADVCERTAKLIVDWMRVGFVHGVMNTDNMSILGLTIDYGPYGWIDGFDTNWTPNTTDAQRRRYRFGAQPQVAMWNLGCLANALVPLIGEPTPLQEKLQAHYGDVLRHRQGSMLRAKLGLRTERPGDKALIESLFEVLALTETDMTLFYRRLASIDLTSDSLEDRSNKSLLGPLQIAYYEERALQRHESRIASWVRAYLARVAQDGIGNNARRLAMNQVNPKYVLRNYIAQLAIDEAEKGNGEVLSEVLDVMRNPYDEQPKYEKYAGRRPEWARHRAGCSMLSCSS